MQDTINVTTVKLNGTHRRSLVFQGHEGSLLKKRERERGMREKRRGAETEEWAKPHQKEKRYTTFKNSFMKTRSRK